MKTTVRRDLITEYLFALSTDALPHHAFLFIGTRHTPDSRPVFEWLLHLGISERIEISSMSQEGGRESIKVERIRACIDELSKTSLAGGYRAVVIDCADDLTEGASNALLKIIEEPPPKTVFALSATDARAVLPTIASRCFAIRFPLPNSAAIAVAYAGRLDAVAYRAAHSFADGAFHSDELAAADSERLEAFFSGQLHASAPVVAPGRIAALYDEFVRARTYMNANLPVGRSLESVFL